MDCTDSAPGYNKNTVQDQDADGSFANGESSQSTIHQSTQTSQTPSTSFPSAAGYAVGVRADCAVIGAIAEESYAGTGIGKNQSEAFQKTSSTNTIHDLNDRVLAKDDSCPQEVVSLLTTIRSAYTPSSPSAMNKLQFSSLGLHGRRHETEVIGRCFNRYVTKSASLNSDGGVDGKMNIDMNYNDAKSNEVVFISGESGTGKTALAESIKDRVARSNGTFTTGKFDLKLRGPYFGIISLFRELCGEMLELRRTNSSKYQELCQSIILDVGTEIGLLTNIAPVLEEAIEIPTLAGAVYEQGNKEAKERLKYAFLQFFGVITRYFPHLVIVLDDLQWADVPSIELLHEIIDDRNIHIMLIGIYRSNEVGVSHYLAKTIRDMHVAKQDRWDLTEISTENLDESICEDILVQLLCVEASAATSRLAKACYTHTAGNVFHFLAYLSMLQEQKLLKRDSQMNKWTWDIDMIEQETEVSSNVVNLIKATISKQPQKLKDLLQLASCLGTSFEKDVIICTFPHMHDGMIGHVEIGGMICELLSMAVQEAFLEQQGNSRFRWVHDAIQSEAMQQISEAEAVMYKYKLGKVLLQSLPEKYLENNLFVIVDLLSANEECPEADKRILLELYLKAAKKAVEFSSFESCIRYAGKGISLLPPNKWITEREVTLELYSLIVEAYYSTGNIDEMKTYGDEILHESTLDELEKVRVHSCNISLCGGSMNKAREALDMSIDVLRKLGCKFPSNKLLQARLALYSLLTMKLPTEEDIAALPHMKDERRKACMEIMVNAATYSHHNNNVFAFIMITTRMVRWTMKYGVDVFSAPGFAIFGMVKKLTSYTTGALYGDRGFQLLDMCKEGKMTRSRVTYLSWFMVYPWSRPIHSTLKHLLSGYKAGLEMGDVESAMWNVSTYICCSIVAGKPLRPLAVDCVTYIEQMQMLKQDYIYHMSLPFAQGVLNLLGEADDPLKLSGSAMVEEEFLDMIETSQGRVMTFLHLQTMKNVICNYFEDFEQGAKLALERGDEYEKKNGSPLAMIDTLHQGVSLYAMARMTKQKKFVKAAKKVKKKVITWVKMGNMNAAHYVLFLKAEDAALESKSEIATEFYHEAINLAATSEFLHDAALASERCAKYLLHELKETDKARQQFQESIRFYSDWGSDYKAELLNQKYSYLWEEEVPNDVMVNIYVCGLKSQNIQEGVCDTLAAAHTSHAALPSTCTRDFVTTAIIEDEGGNESNEPQMINIKTLGLEGDEEADRGGVKEDSTSIDISALTNPYTKPLSRQLSRNQKRNEIKGDRSDNDILYVTNDLTSAKGAFGLILSQNENKLLEESNAKVCDSSGAAFKVSLRCYEKWSAYQALVDLEKELEASIIALDQLNERSHKLNLLSYLLVVRRLRNVTRKEETNIAFGELLKAAKQTDLNGNVFNTIKMMQLELSVQFHDWNGALLCLTEARNMRRSFVGTHASMRLTFLEALVHLKTSTSTSSWLSRHKKKKQAIKLLKILNGWLKKGNDTVRHFMHIIMAECYVLEGNSMSAEDNFNAAISMAALGGFSHDEALAHELASKWYKAEGNEFWSNSHFESSQRLNVEWGASSKVESTYIYYN